MAYKNKKIQVKNYDGTWTNTTIMFQVTPLSFMTEDGATHMNGNRTAYYNFRIADEGITWRAL